MPMIELANGWYHIEILGGETLQDGDYEPTFEFLIQPATNEEATINADMNFSFEIYKLCLLEKPIPTKDEKEIMKWIY